MSLRTDLLTEAERLVTGDRNAAYGEPHQDFQRTADMLTAMGFAAPDGHDLEAHHVALILACVKMSRLVWSPEKRDSWVDLAGYAACGHEAYELTRPEEPLADWERSHRHGAQDTDEPGDGHDPNCAQIFHRGECVVSAAYRFSSPLLRGSLPVCANTLRDSDGLTAVGPAGQVVYCRRTANHPGGCSNDPNYTGNVAEVARHLPPFAG